MPNAKHAQRLAIALFAAFALVACSNENTEAAAQDPGHASGEHGASSSAGLPKGHIAKGEELAKAKGQATGQSCVDCHGAEGNAPIDPSYPKLAGQYADYLAHALTHAVRVIALNLGRVVKVTLSTDTNAVELRALYDHRPSND